MAIDLKIVNERENALLQRRELVIDILHAGEATPSRITLQQLIAKMVGADPEYTEVYDVRSAVGAASSRIRVRVWQEKKVGLHQKREKTAAPAAAKK